MFVFNVAGGIGQGGGGRGEGGGEGNLGSSGYPIF